MASSEYMNKTNTSWLFLRWCDMRETIFKISGPFFVNKHYSATARQTNRKVMGHRPKCMMHNKHLPGLCRPNQARPTLTARRARPRMPHASCHNQIKIEWINQNFTKGQLFSEWIHEVIVSPKIRMKNCQDFCPHTQHRQKSWKIFVHILGETMTS